MDKIHFCSWVTTHTASLEKLIGELVPHGQINILVNLSYWCIGTLKALGLCNSIVTMVQHQCHAKNVCICVCVRR